MTRAIIVVYIELVPTATDDAVQQWIKRLPQDIPLANWVRRVTASDKTNESQPYGEQVIVDLEDASIVNEQLINSLRSKGSGIISQSEWHVYREISQDFRQGVEPDDYPPTGTELIQVGMAPKADSVQDYHDWFDKEHLEMLSDIPGWRSGSRYEWATSYGDGKETAWPYMSANEYEVENGLGGPIWQKSMDTPWTVKVLASLSKPNHRRAWKYVAVEK